MPQPERPARARALSIAAAVLAVSACSTDPETVSRHLVEPAPPESRVADRLGSVELRELSLPEYASGQEVMLQAPDGTLRSGPAHIWADEPSRAMTAALARQLSALTGATVAAEPWPLSDEPAYTLEVRVARAYAGNTGRFSLEGQYFLAGTDEDARDIARSFDISVPLRGSGAAAAAQASAEAVAALAGRIARRE